MDKRKFLGEYIVGKTIGQGAFSKVKIASHRETGEKVLKKSLLLLFRIEIILNLIHLYKKVAIKVIDKKMMDERSRKSKQAHQERERRKQAEEARRHGDKSVSSKPQTDRKNSTNVISAQWFV